MNNPPKKIKKTLILNKSLKEKSLIYSDKKDFPSIALSISGQRV